MIQGMNGIKFVYAQKVKWIYYTKGKGKSLPQQAEVAQGVPGRLRPRIFLKFGATRVAVRQP